VTVAPSHQVGYEISAELYGEFRGLLSDDTIRSCVRDAMTDLRGSISPEALPEMAVRLARVRLTTLAQSRAATAFTARLRLP
jgi:hypothetical protein